MPHAVGPSLVLRSLEQLDDSNVEAIGQQAVAELPRRHVCARTDSACENLHDVREPYLAVPALLGLIEQEPQRLDGIVWMCRRDRGQLLEDE